jgi:uncharacterized membrane protein (UPF0136 family)
MEMGAATANTKQNLYNRLFYLLSVSFLVFCAIVHILLISSDKSFIGPGDASQRTLLSIIIAGSKINLYDLYFWFLVSDWGPLHFILQALVIKLAALLYSEEILKIINALQLFSLTLWFAAILFFAKSVKNICGFFSVGVSILFLAGLPGFFVEASGNMSEIYNLAFLGAGIYFAWAFASSKNKFFIYLSCISFLAATMTRNESIVIIVLTYSFVFILQRDIIIVKIAILASLYFFIRGVYALTFLRRLKDWNFLTVHTSQTLSEPQSLLLNPVVSFYIENKFYLISISMISILFIIISRLLSSYPAKNIFNSAFYFWFWIFIWLSLFLTLGSFAGYIGVQSRYAILSGISFCMIMGIAAGRAISEIRNLKIIFCSISLIVFVSMAFVSVRSNIYELDMPSTVKDIISWINTNSTDDEVIQFDFLGWREQQMLLYTLGRFPGRKSTCHTISFNKLCADSPPHHNPEPGVRPEVSRRTAFLHFVLMEEKPSYISLAQPPTRQIFSRYITANFVRPSHYVEYLLEAEPGKYSFKSPHIAYEKEICFVMAYENADYIVYAVGFH